MKKVYVLLLSNLLLNSTILLGSSNAIIASTGCPISLSENNETKALIDEEKALAEKSQGCLVDLKASETQTPSIEEKKESAGQDAKQDAKKEKKQTKKNANNKKNTAIKKEIQPSEKTEELELDALIKEALA